MDMHPLAANRKLNWRPSLPNIHAFKLVSSGLPENELPQAVDLEPEFTPCYDQMNLGSCVDNAIGALIERNLKLNSYKWQFRPSRLFLYYNARAIEGTIESDAGSTIADSVAAANVHGVCPELLADGSNPSWLWPYIDDGVAFKTEPYPQCYKDAVLHKVLRDEIVNLDRNTVLNALFAHKPFAFGFTVHKSFLSPQMAETGIMHAPGPLDLFDSVVGGHAVVAIGYALNMPMGTQGIKDWVKVRNSWGCSWGIQGSFWMPLDQILCNSSISTDAHAIDLIGF